MNLIDEYRDDIRMEDLPGNYRLIGEECGVDVALKIAWLFGGTNIYLPKLTKIIQRARDERIMKEFNGENYNQLAKKYDLSASWLRELINNYDD